jgi:uncharacterized integral membrane protein
VEKEATALTQNLYSLCSSTRLVVMDRLDHSWWRIYVGCVVAMMIVWTAMENSVEVHIY